jgi:two-component system response regulator YesN
MDSQIQELMDSQELQELKDLRIVVIESSEVIREGLRVAFAEAHGCEVVGMAAGGDEGLSLVLSEVPDVVLMNVSSPQQRGMGLLRTIRKLNQRPIVVIFTTDDSPELKMACREAGATFYALKWQLRDLIELLQLARRFV